MLTNILLVFGIMHADYYSSEFKAIRREFKAREKEEEAQRKVAEENERAAAQAALIN
jgi:hypothetical protein